MLMTTIEVQKKLRVDPGRRICRNRRRRWRICLVSDSTAHPAFSALPTSERRLSD